MKIAFALIPEKGHVNPYIGPAQALADAGHDVVVAAPGDIGEQLSRAGLAFRPDLIRGGDERPTRGPELVALIQDAARLDGWIEQLLLSGVPEQVEAMREWYRRESAEVVVIDPLYYPAAIAAHISGLPWASVSNSLNPVIRPEMDSALLRTVRRLTPRRAELFAGYGMAPKFAGCDVLSPHLNIAFTTEALVGKPPKGVDLVGPSFPIDARGDEAPFRPLPEDRPVVYASFGSQIYFWPEIFERILAAGRSLGLHLVLSIGDLIDDPLWASPLDGCDVYRYAPQLAILKKASAFITHGGANSVMEAVACGVPLLISPMCNDQFHQACFIERAGVGIVENLIHATADRIRERLAALIAPGPVRDAMRAVSLTYQVNGAEAAARRIAALGPS